MEGIDMMFSLLHMQLICTILAQLATVGGVITAFIGINEYRRQLMLQRREAALTLLTNFSILINSIMEIINNPHIYEYEEYYPLVIPEVISEKNVTVHKERPGRLIFNYLNQLKKIYAECSPILGHNEELTYIMDDIDDICKNVIDKLYLEVHSNEPKALLHQLQMNLNSAQEVLNTLIKKL